MTAHATATANVKAALSDEAAEHQLRKVLAMRPAAVLLNEWRRSRRRVEARIRADYPVLRFARPRVVRRANPILIDTDRYRIVRVRARVLAGAGRVDKSPGRRRRLGPSLATEARVVDRLTGTRRTLIRYHLTAEVEHDGRDHNRDGYRDDRPLRVRRHKRERRRLTRLVRKALELGDDVEAGGDSNLDGMPIPCLVSAWDGRRDRGTFKGGRRTIDDVHGTSRATDVILVGGPSDHDAVIAEREE